MILKLPSTKNFFLTKLKIIFPILFIFFLGLLLRLNRLENNIFYLTDAARDMLVAKHYLTDADAERKTSPYADAGLNYLHNSPFYYFYRAVIYTAGGSSVIGSQEVTVVIDALGIFAIFGIGYLLKDKYLGYALGIAYAVHPTFISYAQSQFQPYFLIVFLLYSIFFLFLAVKKTSLFAFVVAWTLLFFAANIHLSSLILTLPYGLISILFARTHKKVYGRIVFLCFFSFLSFTLFIFSYLTKFSWQQFSGWTQTLLVSKPHENIIGGTFYKVGEFGSIFYGQTFFSSVNTLFQDFMGFYMILALTAICLYLLWKNVHQKKLTLELCLSLLFLSWPAILLTSTLKFQAWYCVNHLIVGLIVFLYFLDKIIHSFLSQKYKKYSVFFSAGIFLLYILPLTFFYSSLFLEPLTIRYKEGAEAMLRAAKKYEPNTPDDQLVKEIIIVDDLNDVTLWGANGFWYFLEEESGANLVQVCKEPQNLCPRNTSHKYIFFVCQADTPNCANKVFSSNTPWDNKHILDALHLPEKTITDVKERPIYSVPAGPESTKEFEIVLMTE